VEYEYTYREMQMTTPSGLRALVAAFLRQCPDPAVTGVSLNLRQGDEAYGFRSLDQMLASPLLEAADDFRVRVNVKSRQALYVAAYSRGTVLVSCDGMEPEVAKSLVRSAQEHLGLQPIPVSARAERSVFLAHSFDDAGKQAANVVREVLELLGFRVVTGEAYSPRGVSSKIKERISQQGVAVCMLTRRRGAAGDRGRTSQWVLDEATVAEALEKPVFLLIEKGVEAELGIHGDREYIPFAMTSLHAAIVKLLEGLRELGYQFEPGMDTRD
jgi:hypothetical protein